MVNKQSRSEIRVKKHRRLRHHLVGTAQRPRLSVFRSNNHIAASTMEKAIKDELQYTDNVAAAAAVGTAVAKKALEKGITEVVFDRGGFIYQGKIQALADAAREAGLKF